MDYIDPARMSRIVDGIDAHRTRMRAYKDDLARDAQQRREFDLARLKAAGLGGSDGIFRPRDGGSR